MSNDTEPGLRYRLLVLPILYGLERERRQLVEETSPGEATVAAGFTAQSHQLTEGYDAQ